MNNPQDMTSRQLVEALMADGMSKAEISRAVGRDSSVVSQIASGRKPYANLAPTLAATLTNRRGGHTEVPAAPRRLDRHGREAQVRKPTAGGRTVHVRSAGAIKGGAKSIRNRLRIAARLGQRVAWTLVFPPGVELGKSPKKESHHAEPEDDYEVAELGNAGRGYPAAEFHRAAEETGGDVPAALVQWMVAQNLLDTPDVRPISIELRTWDPE